MNADRCICCGEIVPEGRMVCPACEHTEIKIETTEKAYAIYEWLHSDIDDLIDMDYKN